MRLREVICLIQSKILFNEMLLSNLEKTCENVHAHIFLRGKREQLEELIDDIDKFRKKKKCD